MPPPNNRAFSLVEIVVALSIFSFAILTVIGLMGSSLKVTRDSEERIQAANLATVILARYKGMLQAEADNDTVRWNGSPFPNTISRTQPGEFMQPTGGRFVDALGNLTSNINDAAFGIKVIAWNSPWPSGGGAPVAQLVHCSVRLEWPPAAVAKGNTDHYDLTSSFVVNK